MFSNRERPHDNGIALHQLQTLLQAQSGHAACIRTTVIPAGARERGEPGPRSGIRGCSRPLGPGSALCAVRDDNVGGCRLRRLRGQHSAELVRGRLRSLREKAPSSGPSGHLLPKGRRETSARTLPTRTGRRRPYRTGRNRHGIHGPARRDSRERAQVH